MDGEEGREVGGVGGDQDECEEPPDGHDDPGGVGSEVSDEHTIVIVFLLKYLGRMSVP